MRNIISLTALFILATTSASALDFSKMPGTQSKSEEPVGTDAVVMQEGVVKRYVAAAKNVNEAQTHLAKAFELKDQVATLEAEKTALTSDAVDKSTLEKQTQTSAALNDEVAKRISSGAQLSEEGKKEYSASLAPFAAGVVESAKLPPELQSFATAARQQVNNASLMEKAKVTGKLSAGTYLVSAAPGFISNSASTFKQIVTYAKNNKIPVPKEATDALGSLN